MSSELLRAEGIVKDYETGGHTLRILKGVSMSLAAAEIVAIVGPSGAGKSTLLHIMGFLDRPTQGDVYFRQQCVSALSEVERARLRNRACGFVFQMHHLLPDLSALENVLLPLMIRNGLLEWVRAVGPSRKRARELLERLGLGERLHHRPNQLSGGERQRVALARALVGDPEIVFCDEPTGNLDAASSRGIQQTIRELSAESGKTFVIVTHDMTVAALAARVVRLEDGAIVNG
jgi:lipoprotein-releasing system ATP-binding protein